jgi:hypothetical protein
MISEKKIDEIIEIIGSKKGTTTKQIISALNVLEIKNSGKLISRRKQTLPEVAICKVRREWNKSGGWHWVVLYKGEIYDPDPIPERGIEPIMTLDEYDKVKKLNNEKLSSYILIDL